MKRKRDGSLLIFTGFFLIATLAVLRGLGVLSGLVVATLWNWVAPPLFGAPEVTFLQAWAILFLIGIVGRVFFGQREGK